MRYLVTVAALDQRDGSSLAAVEIAAGLRSRGHAVQLFALRIGELASWVRATHELECLSLSDLPTLALSPPERIVLLHWPASFALQRAGISAPTVFGFLGRAPAMENPPPLVSGLSFPWFAVSEAIEGHMECVSGWSACPHLVVRNWTAFAAGSVRTKQEIHSIAIVSNRLTDELEQQFRDAAQRAGILVTRFGLPHNPQILTEEILSEFDAIVSIGRTVLDAMRLGRPVLIFDIHGADGWVVPEVVAQYARESFSGRERGYRPTDVDLDTWLASPPTSDQLRALQLWVGDNATVDAAIERVEELFSHASRPTSSWGTFGEVSVELIEELAVVRDGLAAREGQLRELRIKADAMANRLRDIDAVTSLIRPRILRRLLATVARRRTTRPQRR